MGVVRLGPCQRPRILNSVRTSYREARNRCQGASCLVSREYGAEPHCHLSLCRLRVLASKIYAVGPKVCCWYLPAWVLESDKAVHELLLLASSCRPPPPLQPERPEVQDFTSCGARTFFTAAPTTSSGQQTNTQSSIPHAEQ